MFYQVADMLQQKETMAKSVSLEPVDFSFALALSKLVIFIVYLI